MNHNITENEDQTMLGVDERHQSLWCQKLSKKNLVKITENSKDWILRIVQLFLIKKFVPNNKLFPL